MPRGESKPPVEVYKKERGRNRKVGEIPREEIKRRGRKPQSERVHSERQRYGGDRPAFGESTRGIDIQEESDLNYQRSKDVRSRRSIYDSEPLPSRGDHKPRYKTDHTKRRRATRFKGDRDNVAA